MAEEPYKQGIYKMKKIILTLILAMFLIVNITVNTSAFTVINIFIDESGDAIFLGETDEDIQDRLPSGITLENTEITGITSELTTKQGELWQFSFSLEGSEFSVILPIGATIIEISGGEISLQGKQILVYTQDQVNIEYILDQGPRFLRSSFSIPIILLLTAALIILIVFLINYTKREKRKEEQEEKKLRLAQKRPKKQDKLAILKQVLSDREKLIIDKLKQTGKIKSSYLRKMTNIPKASFSRHVQELEKKGLIKRTGEGKNKFVELAK